MDPQIINERKFFHERCKIGLRSKSESFVGIQYEKENDDVNVYFPIGYHLGESESDLQSDVLLLIKVLESCCVQETGTIVSETFKFNDSVSLPIQAYLWIISDFSQYGYYIEQEPKYSVKQSGNINWKKTAKTQTPYMQNKNLIYLNFVVYDKQPQLDKLITQIHKYCVYESYKKMGWLYTSYLPEKPDVIFQLNQHKPLISFLQRKLGSTFNTRLQMLFRCMIAILEQTGDPNSPAVLTYGTDEFEMVWETMVDKFYGSPGKECYFPEISWNILNKYKAVEGENHNLIPDTIMFVDKNLYILDSKYYSYCYSQDTKFLPWAESIPKQIIYGEYANKLYHFGDIYNAFVLPFDAKEKNSPVIDCFGSATGNWSKSNDKFRQIRGIFLDTKYLMENYLNQNDDVKTQMATLINKSEIVN